MNLVGLALMLLMGFTLGLLGGGGSILSVPILVYGFKMTAIQATSYSLFIVGCSAFVGAVRNFLKGNVDVVSALTLAAPGFLGVSISRRYIIPVLPESLFNIGSFSLSKDSFVLLCFSILMIVASYSMFFGRKDPNSNNIEYSVLFKVMIGFTIGMVTGFVGAGGGFIIVPVLTNLLALPMKRAVGTSLLVISINSIFGFLGGAYGAFSEVDFSLLFLLSAIGSLGILIGIYFNKFVPAKTLKKGFGVFVFVLGIWIILKQTGFSFA